MQDLLYDPYAAARMTPALVGRQHQISAIQEFVERAGAGKLLHIVGVGGIGKTRLLIHILSQLQTQITARVAGVLVDLYHAETNTVEGLVNEIYQALEPTTAEFPTYRAARSAWEAMRAQQTSTPAELSEQRDAMLQAFVTDMNALAQSRPLIFALDTAEKLELQRDLLAERLGVAQNQTDTVAWLCDLLNQLQNVVVILAGRPGSGQVGNTLKAALGVERYHALELKGLTEQEALAYFKAIIAQLSANSSQDERPILRRVQAIPEAMQQAIFYCLCDAVPGKEQEPTVRPILLALAIDLLTVVTEDEHLAYFMTPLDKARNLSQSERAKIQAWLGQSVINEITMRLQPADQLVWVLGWLRKGATAEMLAEISGLSQEEFAKGWQNLQDLSFIKKRIRDDRYFLHDEMYDILHQNLLSQQVDEVRRRVSTNLRAYHNRKIDDIHTAIDESTIPLAAAPEQRTNLAALIQLQQEERSLIVDDIYYRLRFNAAQGFQSYFRASENAVAAHDVELGELLRTEMRAFVREQGLGNQHEPVDGLRYADIVADEVVRWLEWYYDAGNYREGLALAERLQGELHADLIAPGGVLAQAELDSWHGLLETEVGSDVHGIERIERAIQSLLPRQNTQRWIGILARAYNNLGYGYFSIGRSHRGIDSYKQAIPLWRALKMDSELGNTLNNLAFELAQIGDFDSAQSFVRDGLRLREQQGPRQPVGLSLSTMAEINIKAFASEAAIEHAQRANTIFTDLGYKRGQGLALRALAEAKRRSSVSPTNRQLHKTVILLEESEGHALDALEIFQEQIPELRREIWCLLELGCIYRDWYRWRKFAKPNELSDEEQSKKREIVTLETLFAQSQQNFIAAIEKATTLQPSYMLDAMISWIWLLYYHHLEVEQQGFSLDTCAEIRELQARIEEQITAKYGEEWQRLNTDRSGRTNLLVLLGEWEAFLAESDLRLFQQNQDGSVLHTAATHCVLALTAYKRYSPHIIRQSRRTRTRFYELLKTIPAKELLQFYDAVAAAEEQLNFTDTIMSNFLIEQLGPPESHIALDL